MSSGGRREGAGRPMKKDKKVALVMSVSRHTVDRMRMLSERSGVRQGAIVEALLSRHTDEDILNGGQ